MTDRRSRGALSLALVLVGASVACSPNASTSDVEDVGQTRSAMVGAFPSTDEDDFILFLSHAGDQIFGCGATLIAPNLVVTAKHCVYEFPSESSQCEASGDPAPGSKGGFVTTPIPLASLQFYRGPDGRDRFIKGSAPDASAKQVIDDKTAMLCSHDMAFVVLDKAMPTTLAPARLRLGSRPTEATTVSAAGWGQVEEKLIPHFRQRRDGLKIRRVGAATPQGVSQGIVAPRTFETGAGPCVGDSGGPAFVPENRSALGVIARGLNLDPTNPDSPCLASNVEVVFTIIADFPDVLRSAFEAAQAQPWLEGQAAPGWLRFADACSSDTECEGGRCVGASATAKGSCNLDCSKPARTCPTGYRCGAGAICEAVVPGAGSDPDSPAARAEAEPQAETASCSVGPRSTSSWAAGLGALACTLLGMRLRSRSRRRS